MSRAENLKDVLDGKSPGPPPRGHGVTVDNSRERDPLPDLRETDRPGGYVGRRRRPERD